MAFSVFWILLMSSKICNFKNGLSHYFKKKAVYFRQRKNLKDKKKLLLNDGAIKNNVDVIILITWLMLKFFLKSKDILHQVSNDLGEVNGFYDSVSDAGQKSPPILPFKSSKKPAWYIGLSEWWRRNLQD